LPAASSDGVLLNRALVRIPNRHKQAGGEDHYGKAEVHDWIPDYGLIDSAQISSRSGEFLREISPWIGQASRDAKEIPDGVVAGAVSSRK
jgi:hypothetical protein